MSKLLIVCATKEELPPEHKWQANITKGYPIFLETLHDYI